MAEQQEPIDFSLFGDKLVKPSSGKTAVPTEILKGKVVRDY